MLYTYSKIDFQQDNAKRYSISFTIKVLKVYKIELIGWPINSLNLNPIETV